MTRVTIFRRASLQIQLKSVVVCLELWYWETVNILLALHPFSIKRNIYCLQKAIHNRTIKLYPLQSDLAAYFWGWVSDVDTAWQVLSLISPLGYFTYTINRIKSKIQPNIFLITQFKPLCCWQSQAHVPKGCFRDWRALWMNQSCCSHETADDCSVWLYEYLKSVLNQRCNNVVLSSLLAVQ